MQKSREKYLLCDSSKLNKTYFYDMGSIGQLDGVISDQPLPPEIANRTAMEENYKEYGRR